MTSRVNAVRGSGAICAAARGDLLVLRPVANVPSWSRGLLAGRTAWVVRCHCGREVIVTTNRLTAPRPTTHCGCRYLKPAVEPRPISPAAPVRPVAEHTTSSAEALRQFHDERSPLGKVRVVMWPVDEDAEAGVLHDGDPFAWDPAQNMK